MTLFDQVDLIGTRFWRIGRWYPEYNSVLYNECVVMKIIGDTLYLDDGSFILKEEFDRLQSQEISVFERIFLDKEKFDKMLEDMIKTNIETTNNLTLCC